MKPIYLFADSQLLFWKPSGKAFLGRLRDDVEVGSPKAAYIGASNGDEPEFFSIFEAAMDAIGIRETCMVHSEPSEEEMAFLDEADLILLAGGDPLRGFRVMERNGVRDTVARRYYEGALLCGVSAGAVQLGFGTPNDGERGSTRLVGTLRLVPCIIGVHEERSGWKALERAARAATAGVKAIGIPFGGGLVFHSEDNSMEPIRRPLHELTFSDEGLEERILFPVEEAIDPVAVAGE
jgi:cyanophycinase